MFCENGRSRIVKFTKRQLIALAAVIILAFFLSMYKLPFYIHKPGSADALNPIVQVDGGYESKGDMHLVTIGGLQATPIQYLWAKLSNHQEVVPISEVRPEGITEEQYKHAQLQMMEGSQEKAKAVAYEAADEDVSTTFGARVVNVIEDMPADGILEMGDLITEIDGDKIKEAEDLTDYMEEKETGETVTLTILRDHEDMTKDITLESFAEEDDKVGVGVQLMPGRDVTVDPEVTFSSGEIGGPSAGLMFSLKIYDQLIEEDLTIGQQIAGTGEIDYDGNVKRIGGVDKKVIAADDAGSDIFFAPNEKGREDSNYEVAKQTAEDIGSDMEVVPVDTFDDALDYLEELE